MTARVSALTGAEASAIVLEARGAVRWGQSVLRLGIILATIRSPPMNEFLLVREWDLRTGADDPGKEMKDAKITDFVGGAAGTSVGTDTPRKEFPMLRLVSAFCSTALITACSMTPTTPAVSAAAVSQLTPTGKLRAAINYGNAVLAKRDAATGEVSGVSVDLSHELARRLGVELQLLPVDTANKSVEAIKNEQADIAFFAIDPLRGAGTDYTAAYVVIEGTYVVPQGSGIKINADVDKPGTRIAVAAKSAYDLFLTREIRQASLVRTSTSGGVVDMFVEKNLEVAAGVKQQLEKDMRRVPGLRMLEGRFMEINQAMGTSKGRDEGIKYLRAFIEEMKASGFVAKALERHRIEGVAVAP